MQIGTVWGLTAPLAMLAFDSKDEIKSIINSKEMMQCFRTECRVLLNTLGNSEIHTRKLDDRDYSNYTISNGRLINADGCTATDTDLMQFENYCSQLAVDRILIDLRNGGRYDFVAKSDIELRAEIGEGIKGIVAAKDACNADPKKISMEFVRSKRGAGNFKDSLALAEAFGCSIEPPDVVSVRGSKQMYELTGTDKVVWGALLRKSSLLRECCGMQLSSKAELSIFGSNALDLLIKEPKALKAMVASQFKLVSDVSNRELLKNTINNVREGMEQFIAFKETAIRTNFNAGTEGVNRTDALKAFNDTGAAEFYSNSLEGNAIPEEDVTQETISLLEEVYTRCKCVDVNGLNKLTGLQLTESEWMQVSERLARIGVVGIHPYSLQLLEEMLGNSVWSFSDKVMKKEEEVERIDATLADINSLLDTLLPIGGNI